jgi:DNA-binding response OmpR family regulator
MEHLPAIFLSAKVTDEDIEIGRAAGATYLTKPFIASALLAAIDEAIVPTLEAW